MFLDSKILMWLAGVFATLIAKLIYLVWKLSQAASKIKSLDHDVTKLKSDMIFFNDEFAKNNTKLEVLSNNISNLSTQLSTILAKQDKRLEKIEDAVLELSKQTAKHSQCYYLKQ